MVLPPSPARRVALAPAFVLAEPHGDGALRGRRPGRDHHARPPRAEERDEPADEGRAARLLAAREGGARHLGRDRDRRGRGLLERRRRRVARHRRLHPARPLARARHDRGHPRAAHAAPPARPQAGDRGGERRGRRLLARSGDRGGHPDRLGQGHVRRSARLTRLRLLARDGEHGAPRTGRGLPPHGAPREPRAAERPARLRGRARHRGGAARASHGARPRAGGDGGQQRAARGVGDEDGHPPGARPPHPPGRGDRRRLPRGGRAERGPRRGPARLRRQAPAALEGTLASLRRGICITPCRSVGCHFSLDGRPRTGLATAWPVKTKDVGDLKCLKARKWSPLAGMRLVPFLLGVVLLLGPRSGWGCQLPATDQTTCWNNSGSVIPCAGTGEDGDLREGAPLAYVDNGDGTVTDVTTGHMREKLSHDGTVHDDHNTYTWANAISGHVATLNRTNFARHNDWRLPNVRELLSIVTYQNLLPTVSPAFNTNCTSGCTVLTCSCTTSSSGYWSSATAPSNPSTAGVLDTGGGGVCLDSKSVLDNVRGVRGGS